MTATFENTIDKRKISAAAKLIGAEPAALRRQLRKAFEPDRVPLTRKQWIDLARDTILSVPPDHNAERLAEMLWDRLASGRRPARRRG